MTAREFFFLVKNMREAQSAYFRTRDRKELVRSKGLERQVDNEIRRVSEIINS